jgi:hypothetical protein
MIPTNRWLGFVACFAVLICFPSGLFALTAPEILEKVGKESLGESFRLTLSSKTIKGNKTISSHRLWLMGKLGKETGSFFLDFEEPEESKGLRFLLKVALGKEPMAYMYLPATGKTLPLAIDDPSVDIGGTGLMTEDIQGFMPAGDEKSEIVKEEKSDGRECYVIRVSRPGEKDQRLIWVTKNNFIVLRSETLNPEGKVTRALRVVEFFQAAEGKEFPREEEITIPGKDTRIILRQEQAVFDVEIPAEVLDPATFGTFKWKSF